MGVGVVGSAVGRIFDIIEYRASRVDRFWHSLKTEYLYISIIGITIGYR